MDFLEAQAKRMKAGKAFTAKVLSTNEGMSRLLLSVPPSINSYYATVNGRRILSKTGREYKKILSYMRVKQLSGSIGVQVVLKAKDKRRRDLDNILKALLDALGGCGLYDDDSQIDELTVIRGDKDPEHIIEVTVWERSE